MLKAELLNALLPQPILASSPALRNFKIETTALTSGHPSSQKMLLLNNFLVFLGIAIGVLSFKTIDHEIAKTYDVVLNETSAMTAKGHAEWANYVHMRSLKKGKQREVDKLLGAGTWQVTGPKSYRISVNNHTMHRIKEDKDVGIAMFPYSASNTQTYEEYGTGSLH
jgi:hypothetical protein